jgi:hypothetical protein
MCNITNWKERSKNQSGLGSVHYGGEGPHWAVVPSKKKRRKRRRLSSNAEIGMSGVMPLLPQCALYLYITSPIIRYPKI